MNDTEVFLLDEKLIARKVLARRVDVFNDHAVAAAAFSLLGALLLAWLEAGTAGWSRSGLWLLLISVLELMVLLTGLRYRSADRMKHRETKSWARWLVFMHFVTGVAWGSSVWFFWVENQYLHYLLNIAVLIGVSGICIVVMAPFFASLALFAGGVLLLPVLHLVGHANPLALEITVGLGLLFFIELQFGRMAGNQLLAGLENAVRSEELASELANRTLALEASYTELNKAQTVGHLGSWNYDPTSDLVHLSGEACRIFGIPRFSVLRWAQFSALVHEEDRDGFERAWREAVATSRLDHEHRILFENEPRWVHQRAEFEMSYEGRMIRAVGISQDITEKKEADIALRESETRYRTMIEWSPEAIVVHRTGKLLYTNREAIKTFGARFATDLIGRSILDFVHPQYHQMVLERASRTTEMGVTTPMVEEQFLKIDGTVIDVEAQSIAIVFDGKPATQVLIRDITERKAAARQIEHLAFYDSLTHLPNRRLMLDRLGQALTTSERRADWGALMLIDLDNFKTLNDTAGHAIGDLLLLEAATRLRSLVRQADTVARLGGDEFVVILENLGDSAPSVLHAEEIAQKMLGSLAQPFHLQLNNDPHTQNTHHHQCTASIGITMFRGQSVTVDELMKRSDTAMYQAKGAGRNAIRFYDPELQKTIEARAALELDLRKAITDNQFILHLQPQVDQHGGVFGAEVLVRWLHPHKGLIPPAQFIPLSEETGLILQIGRWVMHAACVQLALWSRLPSHAHLTLAVNVSAREFSQTDFTATVLDILRTTGAPAYRLKIELTESLLLNNTQAAIACMNQLRQEGIGFSLDDFGTGYSSISYLKHLPLDQLKIDQSFVRDIASNKHDVAIVKTIITLGQSLDLKVVAEGVETTEQLDLLAALGCAGFQGYFFGRPMPLEAFENFAVAHAGPASVQA